MIMGLLVRLRMGELTKCINPGGEERGKDPSRNGDECMCMYNKNGGYNNKLSAAIILKPPATRHYSSD